MTLDYQGQLIDISGTDSCKIYNKKTNKWQRLPTDFSKSEIKNIFELDVPVIGKDELLFYKKIIARPGDLIDVKQLAE